MDLFIADDLRTVPGGANLDRKFNSTDLVTIFRAGGYATTTLPTAAVKSDIAMALYTWEQDSARPKRENSHLHWPANSQIVVVESLGGKQLFRNLAPVQSDESTSTRSPDRWAVSVARISPV